jgi:hypothetical protein
VGCERFKLGKRGCLDQSDSCYECIAYLHEITSLKDGRERTMHKGRPCKVWATDRDRAVTLIQFTLTTLSVSQERNKRAAVPFAHRESNTMIHLYS